jgi:hypothetical protein
MRRESMLWRIKAMWAERPFLPFCFSVAFSTLQLPPSYRPWLQEDEKVPEREQQFTQTTVVVKPPSGASRERDALLICASSEVTASEAGNAPGVVCLGGKVDDSFTNQSGDIDRRLTSRKMSFLNSRAIVRWERLVSEFG